MSDVSSKRERELARAKFERQQQRRTAKQKRALFLKVLGYSAAGIAVISYLVLQSNKELEPIVPSTSPTNAAAPVVTGCVEASAPRANNITYPAAPTDLKPASKISFSTNCGDISVTTDKLAPKTVGILSYLAQNGFYDGIKCHRLTTDGIFVLQCGDPAGNGSGGPGFQFEDENLPKADASGSTIYPRGTVAMANSGPNTNGSQFFLVYQDSPLPPNYSVWGTITTGLDLLDSIAKAGTSNGSTDGPPAQEVVINRATTTP